jgi:hypothetical protein
MPASPTTGFRPKRLGAGGAEGRAQTSDATGLQRATWPFFTSVSATARVGRPNDEELSMQSRSCFPRRPGISAAVLSVLCVAAVAGEMPQAAAGGPSAAAPRAAAARHHPRCPPGHVLRHGRCVIRSNDPYGGVWADPRNKSYPASGVSASLIVRNASVVHFNFSIIKDCAQFANGDVGGVGDATRKGNSFSYSFSDPRYGSVAISGTFSSPKRGSGHASATIHTSDSKGNFVDCTGEANLTFARP